MRLGVPPFAIRGRTWRSSPPEGDVLQGAGNSPAQKGKEAVSVGIRGPVAGVNSSGLINKIAAAWSRQKG